MTARHALRLLTIACLLAGGGAVLGLGAVLVHHLAGLRGGRLLAGWAVAFAVLLPAGLTAMALLAPRGPRRARQGIIPNAGWKVPGAGQ